VPQVRPSVPGTKKMGEAPICFCSCDAKVRCGCGLLIRNNSSIKPPWVFGTAGSTTKRRVPILCVLCKGWDTRRSVSRFVVSHPSQNARRMGHPGICCTFCRGQEMPRFMPRGSTTPVDDWESNGNKSLSSHVPRISCRGWWRCRTPCGFP